MGFEPVAVDRTVENHGRDHAVQAEAGDERRGLSMAVRNRHAQALAPGAAPMRAGHVRRRPGLVRRPEGDRKAICREGGRQAVRDRDRAGLRTTTDASSGCPGAPTRPRGRSILALQPMALEESRLGRGRCRDATPGETDANFLEAPVALPLRRRHHRRALPSLQNQGKRTARPYSRLGYKGSEIADPGNHL